YSVTTIVGNSDAQRPHSESYSFVDVVGGGKNQKVGVGEGNYHRRSGTFDSSSRRSGTFDSHHRRSGISETRRKSGVSVGVGEVEEWRIPLNAILVRNEVEWEDSARTPEPKDR
ncbi:MAG: hypothetical protein Q9187_008959, partial [Circinaria calcarea]